MKWGEFKKLVEDMGISNHDDIVGNDISMEWEHDEIPCEHSYALQHIPTGRRIIDFRITLEERRAGESQSADTLSATRDVVRGTE